MAVAMFLIAAAPIPSAVHSNPQPIQHPVDRHQEPSYDKRGTDNSPLIVKMAHTKEGDEQTAQEAAYKAEDTRNNTLLMIFNGLLFLVAAAEFIWIVRQENWMKKSVKAAQDAANAAKQGADTAERSLNYLETPFLYPVIVDTNISDSFHYFERYDHPTSPGSPVTPTVSFKIRNYGRTLALLHSIAFQFEHLTMMVPKPRVDFLSEGTVDPVLEPNGLSQTGYSKSIIIPITKEGHASITRRDSHLFLYGEIEFSDIFGNGYVQTFCLEWHPHAKRFVPWWPQYNQRKRKERTKA